MDQNLESYSVICNAYLRGSDKTALVNIRRRQHDLGPPDKLSRSVAVADQGLKLSTVGGAKVKADVIASHAPNMAHHVADGNLLSGAEH